MIDMNFLEFLALLILSLIAALVVHYAIHYPHSRSVDGFFLQWTVGWIFAWLGSPVFGHWFASLRTGNVYWIPALLGGFVGSFFAAVIWKTIAMPQKTMTQ
jgi:uncharacterized membrane protein YeaQ/YmgE (transglycosylase-associated protein family)